MQNSLIKMDFWGKSSHSGWKTENETWGIRDLPFPKWHLLGELSRFITDRDYFFFAMCIWCCSLSTTFRLKSWVCLPFDLRYMSGRVWKKNRNCTEIQSVENASIWLFLSILLVWKLHSCNDSAGEKNRPKKQLGISVLFLTKKLNFKT